MMNGIMLYARATSTNGKYGERGPIDIRAKLTAKELEDHEILLAIRNRVGAHVYSHEAIDGVIWHHDRLFLVEFEGGGWKPASATIRLQLDRQSVDRLERQIAPAHKIIRKQFDKHINDLTALLNVEPLKQAVLDAHLFDPVSYFGSEKAVARLLKGAAEGKAFGFSSGPKVP